MKREARNCIDARAVCFIRSPEYLAMKRYSPVNLSEFKDASFFRYLHFTTQNHLDRNEKPFILPPVTCPDRNGGRYAQGTYHSKLLRTERFKYIFNPFWVMKMSFWGHDNLSSEGDSITSIIVWNQRSYFNSGRPIAKSSAANPAIREIGSEV